LPKSSCRNAALGVDVGDAQALDYAVGFPPAVDADPAIPLLFCVVEPAFHAVRRAHGLVQVVRLRLELLHTEEVGLLRGQPVEQALAAGRTDAVEVEGDDA